jgi:3'-5' exoribonuclease
VIGKNTFVKDLVPGRPVDDLYVIAEAKTGQAKNGPFWTSPLRTPPARWRPHLEPREPPLSGPETGRLVRVEGMAGSYRDKTQISVDRLEILAHRGYGPADASFHGRERVPPQEILIRLETLCRERIRHAPGGGSAARCWPTPRSGPYS